MIQKKHSSLLLGSSIKFKIEELFNHQQNETYGELFNREGTFFTHSVPETTEFNNYLEDFQLEQLLSLLWSNMVGHLSYFYLFTSKKSRIATYIKIWHSYTFYNTHLLCIQYEKHLNYYSAQISMIDFIQHELTYFLPSVFYLGLPFSQYI